MDETEEIKEEDYNDSLDYLRAKYLKGSTLKYSAVKTAKAMSPCSDDVRADTLDELQYLRSKYLKKGISLGRLSLCDILVLCVVFVTALCSVIWFAQPVTELGGEVFKGKTINLFSFLFGSDQSILNQIKTGFTDIENISSDPGSAIGSFMKIVRAIFLGCSGIYVLINILIEVVSAAVYFFGKKRSKLISVSVRSVINKLKAYIIFVFFGSVSGGIGVDSYYIGYSAGTGMTVGVLLGVSILIAVSIGNYVSKRKVASLADKQDLIRFACSGIAYTAIAIVVTFMRIYSVFIYSMTSTLTAAAGLASGSFKIKSLLFPALNVFLLVASQSIVNTVTVGFKISFERLLSYGYQEKEEIKAGKRKQIKYSQLRYMIVIAVMSAFSCLTVFALNIPTIGYEWSVNIYPHMVAIFAVSSVATVFNAIIFNYRKEG